MARKMVVYESDDGEFHKSKKAADLRNSKLASERAVKRLDMTKEEISKALDKISPRNFKVAALLKNESDWTKWFAPLIDTMNKELFAEPKKITQYVVEGKTIATEEGDSFTDADKYLGEEYLLYKTEDFDKYKRMIHYKNKYTYEEKLERKLLNKEELSESELSSLSDYFDVVYEEKGENRRWSRSVLTIMDISGRYYALSWEEGLTENQPSEYWEQPYEVDVFEEEVTVIKTRIVKK